MMKLQISFQKTPGGLDFSHSDNSVCLQDIWLMDPLCTVREQGPKFPPDLTRILPSVQMCPRGHETQLQGWCRCGIALLGCVIFFSNS